MRAAALLLAASVIAGGCGGGAGPSLVCPNDVPATCPAPAPSFAAEVMPLLRQRCGACHTAGGLSETHPFDTYQQVQLDRITIGAQLHSCLMPPADQPQLTPAERQIIFGWLVCGAMNN